MVQKFFTKYSIYNSSHKLYTHTNKSSGETREEPEQGRKGKGREGKEVGKGGHDDYYMKGRERNPTNEKFRN